MTDLSVRRHSPARNSLNIPHSTCAPISTRLAKRSGLRSPEKRHLPAAPYRRSIALRNQISFPSNSSKQPTSPFASDRSLDPCLHSNRRPVPAPKNWQRACNVALRKRAKRDARTLLWQPHPSLFLAWLHFSFFNHIGFTMHVRTVRRTKASQCFHSKT